jgi:Pyruvate/2-oxoacid:ferredoxin oxidoreductase delta subunit
MSDESYERLAAALDALPNGFPRTPSRVELRIMKKAFTDEEAKIAGYMTRTYESVIDISTRTGMDQAVTDRLLEALLPRGLVRMRIVDGQRRYRLGPFIVGWCEAMLSGPMRNDIEFAELMEQYMREGSGERIMAPRPGVLGVVPARGSLKPDLLQPYDDIDAHFARYERFRVGDCVCRLERNTLGSTCTRPVNRCGFVGLPPQTPLSNHVLDREQALKLFAELEDEGHVHTGFYGFVLGAESPQFVGCCNCCGDCCAILRVVNEFGVAEGPQRSNYRAVLNVDNCIACSVCVERCQMHAITQDTDGIVKVNRNRCIGCGLCVIRCSSEALELVPVSKEEWFDVPSSFEEWEERRLLTLGLMK